jgi:plastocyanin
MHMLPNLAVLSFLAIAFAQYGHGSKSSSTGGSPAPATTSSGTPTTSSTQGVHTVVVAKDGGLVYTLDSITAAVGDKVEFHFEISGHSVAEGDFSNPCAPLGASAFFSGFVNVGVIRSLLDFFPVFAVLMRSAVSDSAIHHHNQQHRSNLVLLYTPPGLPAWHGWRNQSAVSM